MENWFSKLFINEAKPALSRHSGSGGGAISIDSRIASSLDELSRWYDFTYYDSIVTAILDIETDTIGTNSIPDNNGAEVCVYTHNDVPCIVLLRDATIENKLDITVDMFLNLCGFTLTSMDAVAFVVGANHVVIDGRTVGSKVLSTPAEGEKVSVVDVTSGTCTIIGGMYSTSTSGVGTEGSPNAVINVSSDATLDIAGVTIRSTDDDGGSINGILGEANSVICATDCSIDVSSKHGFNVCGVNSEGDVTLVNCSVVAEADHTANSAGTNYATMSRGVYSAGSLLMRNCYVYGTHSAATSKGTVTVEGGKYEGYSHGGLYLSGSSQNINVYDAELIDCDLRDGYIDDGRAGTNGAGIYIGGASNITVYMDNCNIYAKIQPIVLRGSSGERNNTFYVSRTRISHGYTNVGVRIDHSTHKVYIGTHCNFTASNTNRASVVQTTAEVYRNQE